MKFEDVTTATHLSDNCIILENFLTRGKPAGASEGKRLLGEVARMIVPPKSHQFWFACLCQPVAPVAGDVVAARAYGVSWALGTTEIGSYLCAKDALTIRFPKPPLNSGKM